MNKYLVSFLVLAILGVGACASQNIHFTNSISNPSPQDKEYLKSNFVLLKNDASVTFNRDFFMYIPVNGYQSFSDELVVDTLLERYGADLITDLKVEKSVMLYILFNRYTVVGQGDVWKRK